MSSRRRWGGCLNSFGSFRNRGEKHSKAVAMKNSLYIRDDQIDSWITYFFAGVDHLSIVSTIEQLLSLLPHSTSLRHVGCDRRATSLP